MMSSVLFKKVSYVLYLCTFLEAAHTNKVQASESEVFKFTKDECEKICQDCDSDSSFTCSVACTQYKKNSLDVENCINLQEALKASKEEMIKEENGKPSEAKTQLKVLDEDKIRKLQSGKGEIPDLSNVLPMDIMKYHNEVVRLDQGCFKVYYDMCVLPTRPPYCEVDDYTERATKVKLDKLRFRSPVQSGSKIVYQAQGHTSSDTENAYVDIWGDNEKMDLRLYMTLEPDQCTARSPLIRKAE